MSDEPKTYEIRQLTDFVNVPREKIDDCLADFKEWLEFHRQFHESGIPGLADVFLEPYMIWKDDGKRGISEIKITRKEGK